MAGQYRQLKAPQCPIYLFRRARHRHDAVDEAFNGARQGGFAKQKHRVEVALNLIEMMGGHHNRAFALFLPEDLKKALTLIDIEAQVGLIQQHQLAAGSYGEDKAHRGLLTAGQAGVVLLRDRKLRGKFFSPLLVPSLPPRLTNAEELVYVPAIEKRVINAHQDDAIHDLLVVKGTLPKDFQPLRLELACDHAQQRRLAHSIGTHQAVGQVIFERERQRRSILHS